MPDKYGFDHLPWLGITYHRCIEEECGWPGHNIRVSDADRALHHRQHERARERVATKAKNQALHKARQAAAEKRRIDKIVYGRQKGAA